MTTTTENSWSHNLSHILNPDFANHKNVLPKSICRNVFSSELLKWSQIYDEGNQTKFGRSRTQEAWGGFGLGPVLGGDLGGDPRRGRWGGRGGCGRGARAAQGSGRTRAVIRGVLAVICGVWLSSAGFWLSSAGLQGCLWFPFLSDLDKPTREGAASAPGFAARQSSVLRKACGHRKREGGLSELGQARGSRGQRSAVWLGGPRSLLCSL